MSTASAPITLDTHLANLHSLFYHLLIGLLSLIPIAIISLVGVWTMTVSTKPTRGHIEMLLSLWIPGMVILHLYAFFMLYNLWEPAMLMPISWTIAYSDLIVCAGAVGVIVLVGTWRVARKVLFWALPVAEETKETEKKAVGGKDGKGNLLSGKKEE